MFDVILVFSIQPYVTRFAKRSLKGTVSRHVHFSLPSAAHVFNTAEGCTVCFHSGLYSSLSDVH